MNLIFKVSLSLSMVLLFSNVNGQSYDTLDFENMTWNSFEQPFAPAIMDSMIYQGEEIINGHSYASFKSMNLPSMIFHPVSVYLRNDTVNGLSWYRTTNDPNDIEFLFLNMNLELSDTAVVYNDSLIVDSVYYKMGRKYIQFDRTVSFAHYENRKFTMIEGVGWNVGVSSRDLVNPFGDNSFLTCAHEFDSLIYIHDYPDYTSVWDNQCATYYTSIKENTLVDLKIYPNPVENGELRILGSVTKVNLRIYSTQAKLVYERNDYLLGNTIDVSDLSPGLYVVSCKANQLTYNGVLVIK